MGTAKAVYKHRKVRDLPLSAREPQGPPPKVIPSDVVPAFTYGKKTCPSTPIASVVSYQSASEFEEDISTQYEYLRQDRERAKETRKIRLTKAAYGHATGATKMGAGGVAADPKEPFKIKKFSKVLSKVGFPGGKSSELKRISD